jgi:hypothetical protein
MLKGGADLELQKDQEVVLVAVGAAYETFEGGKDEATGERPCLLCHLVTTGPLRPHGY